MYLCSYTLWWRHCDCSLHKWNISIKKIIKQKFICCVGCYILNLTKNIWQGYPFKQCRTVVSWRALFLRNNKLNIWRRSTRMCYIAASRCWPNSLLLLHEDLGSDSCVTRERTMDTSRVPSSFQVTDRDKASWLQERFCELGMRWDVGYDQIDEVSGYETSPWH